MADRQLGVDLAGPDLVPTYQGDLALVEGVENVRGALIRRLNIPLGGLFAHPAYGNPVYDLLSQPIDTIWAGKAAAGIRQCLQDEARITVEDIRIQAYPEERRVSFTIEYRITDNPDTQNLIWQVNTL